MQTGNRPDIYAKVHRGLRVSLYNLSTLIGRTEFTDDREVGAMRAGALEVLHFLDEHAHNEERWILALLEEKSPGSADHDHESHERIEAELDEFRRALDDIAQMPVGPERSTAGETLYHQYNRFLSGYLLHMEEEERETTASLHKLCTDNELRGITANIMQHSKPDDLEMALRAFIPAIDKRLRNEFVSEVASSAPPEVTEWLLGIARDTLVEKEFSDLVKSLPATA